MDNRPEIEPSIGEENIGDVGPPSQPISDDQAPPAAYDGPGDFFTEEWPDVPFGD